MPVNDRKRSVSSFERLMPVFAWRVIKDSVAEVMLSIVSMINSDAVLLMNICFLVTFLDSILIMFLDSISLLMMFPDRIIASNGDNTRAISRRDILVELVNPSSILCLAPIWSIIFRPPTPPYPAIKLNRIINVNTAKYL